MYLIPLPRDLLLPLLSPLSPPHGLILLALHLPEPPLPLELHLLLVLLQPLQMFLLHFLFLILILLADLSNSVSVFPLQLGFNLRPHPIYDLLMLLYLDIPRLHLPLQLPEIILHLLSLHLHLPLQADLDLVPPLHLELESLDHPVQLGVLLFVLTQFGL